MAILFIKMVEFSLMSSAHDWINEQVSNPYYSDFPYQDNTNYEIYEFS